jgi:diguanylate cyclase (GGDEF)-like protein
VLEYLLIVAVVNVGLGFFLAVHLGRRYEELGAESDLAAMGILDGPVASPLSGQAGDGQPPNDIEAVARDLHAHVHHYGACLSDTDQQLRRYAELPDAAAIEACLDSLLSATEEYLENRGAAYEQFVASGLHDPPGGELQGRLGTAMQVEDAEIEATQHHIAAFDYQGDLKAGCRQIIGHASQLRNANYHLRDTLQWAVAQVARDRQPLDASSSAARQDPLTGASDRIGLEAALKTWWQNDPERIRRLTLAMFDIDRFSGVNDQFGCTTGDEILRAIAQLFEAERQAELTLARFSGQRFVLLFPDADLRYTTNVVERIRQTIEHARFRCRDQDLSITVSCAVTASGADDTADSLFARAEAALQEAKRYGRNRTFLYEGKYPTPVVPPNLEIERRTITL